MRMSAFRRAMAAAALGAILALSGCSGGNDPKPAPEPSPAPAPDSTPSPEPTPRELTPNEQLVADIAARASEGLICVVEYVGNTVTFLTADGEELGTLNVGVNPAAMVATADKNQVYIANSGNGEVVRITFAPEPSIERVRVGTRPMALALDEEAGLLYVADYYLNSIRMLDIRLMSLVGTIQLEAKGFAEREDPPDCCFDPLDGTVLEGRRPVSCALSPDGKRLFTGNIGTYDESIVDLEASAEVGKYDGVIGMRDVVLSPDGTYLLIAGVGSEVIESNELIVRLAADGSEVARIHIGKDVAAVAWQGSTVAALAKETGEFCLIDPETWTVSRTLQMEPGIADVSLSADGSRAYVGNSDTGDVTCLDTATLDTVWTVEALADPRFILAL